MLIYYILITLVSIVIIISAYFGYDMSDVAQSCAQAGIRLLFITLLIKPLTLVFGKATECRIWSRKTIMEYIQTISIKWMKYRRLLGITTFLLLFIHGGVNIVGFAKMWYAFPEQLKNVSLLFGYIALSLLFLAYVTSNNFSVKILKKYWKSIQAVAYLTLILGVLHVVILDPAEFRWYLIFLVIYFYLKGVEKGKLPFLKL